MSHTGVRTYICVECGDMKIESIAKLSAPATDQTLIEKLKSFDFGCQSVISGGAVTLLLCSGAAIAFIPKKKKRE